jgi:hypothetical protein
MRVRTVLRKTTISFVISVRLSGNPPVRVQQLGYQSTDFHLMFKDVYKNVDKFQVSLKCDKNKGYFT